MQEVGGINWIKDRIAACKIDIAYHERRIAEIQEEIKKLEADMVKQDGTLCK